MNKLPGSGNFPVEKNLHYRWPYMVKLDTVFYILHPCLCSFHRLASSQKSVYGAFKARLN